MEKMFDRFVSVSTPYCAAMEKFAFVFMADIAMIKAHMAIEAITSFHTSRLSDLRHCDFWFSDRPLRDRLIF